MRELLAVEPSSDAGLRVCLTYPNEYRGMASNLGFHIVHRILAEIPGVSVERSYVPTDAYGSLGPNRTLVSLETGSPLSEFDIVGFSLQFELDYPHVLEALVMGGIPIRREDRDEGDPLVLAGGPCTVNPRPLEPYVDVFYVGEAEAGLEEGIEVILTARDRRDALEEVADLPGFYVPEYPGTVDRMTVDDLGETEPPKIAFAPENVEHTGLRAYPVELSRGCPHRCAFCLGGFTAGHVRHRPVEQLLEVLEDVEKSPYDRAAMISSSPTLHPGFEKVLEECLERRIEISLPSIRIDDLDPELLPELRKAGVRTLTLAPESGSEDILEFLNKPLDRDHLLELVESAGKLGMRVKLYFIVGIPGFFPEEDAVASARLARECAELADVRVSVNPLIPKAFTPLQYSEMLSSREIDRRYRLFRREFGGRVSFEDPELARAQCLLSRGDVDVSRILEEVLWNAKSPGAWARAMRSHRVSISPDRPPDGPEDVPYGFVRAGPDHEELYRLFASLQCAPMR
ncbi:B12-binding domain-containing radical SAM protein [Methanopyrus sp.]